MVNVDFSPALVLGMGFVACGLSLYQLRRIQPELSRDFDVVVSSIAIFSGGILVFQGWRLDPLLLFCQLLTAGTALGFALEALRLRQQTQANPVTDERLRFELRPDVGDRQPQSDISLPEPGEASYGQWSGGAAGPGWPRAQQWQDNVYPAEYDIPAERGSGAEAGSYQGYDAAPSDLGQPGEWTSDGGYRPSYLDSRYDDRPEERSAGSDRPGQWGRSWTSRIDVEASDDWD
ncbi:hypothetical protein WJX81_001075 [Elliptochloris bilobata]|uniref:Ycf66 n=1 Tax=Elliptochloris bilobata TaxID=381761 RepID=A0AAW1RFV0_9CHLO